MTDKRVLPASAFNSTTVEVRTRFDGYMPLVELWFNLPERERLVDTESDGSEEAFDFHAPEMTIEQAKALHAAIGEAIALLEAEDG